MIFGLFCQEFQATRSCPYGLLIVDDPKEIPITQEEAYTALQNAYFNKSLVDGKEFVKKGGLNHSKQSFEAVIELLCTGSDDLHRTFFVKIEKVAADFRSRLASLDLPASRTCSALTTIATDVHLSMLQNSPTDDLCPSDDTLATQPCLFFSEKWLTESITKNKMLGEGGFGKVVAADFNGQQMAIKYPTKKPGDMVKEVVIPSCSIMRHKNIVGLLGFGSFRYSFLAL